jgi:hypothetical protein
LARVSVRGTVSARPEKYRPASEVLQHGNGEARGGGTFTFTHALVAKLRDVLVTACLLAPTIAYAAVLWDVTFTALAYNTVTGELGDETARYRYDPDDLVLIVEDLVFTESYTLDGTILNHFYHGVDNGAGGRLPLTANNPDFFHNTVRFGGTAAADFNEGEVALRTPFWKEPHEVSIDFFWVIPNGEGRVPLVGGEGDFIWLEDIGHYFDLFGAFPDPSMLPLVAHLTVSQVSQASEPATLALLFLALVALGPALLFPRCAASTPLRPLGLEVPCRPAS